MKELVGFLNWETTQKGKSALGVYHDLFLSPGELSCVFIIEKDLFINQMWKKNGLNLLYFPCASFLFLLNLAQQFMTSKSCLIN